MLSKTLFTACLVIMADARFGQEQVPIPAISEVQGGDPGEAPTIAGAAVSDLLGGANACAKLQRADEIMAKLGDGDDALQAAIGMVAAEKNFNPFTEDAPTICSDPALPTTEALRGITPLIDPDVEGADVANKLSAQTKANPLDATGLSVADLLQQNGFSNFTTQDADGTAGAAGGSSNANTASGSATTAASSSSSSSSSSSNNINADQQQSSGSSSSSSSSSSTNSSTSTTTSTSSKNLDFGKCTPTMRFEGGLGGRPADEFTFIPTDPLVAEGQQEALNPNIITNRICDQLTNVCDAADDAKAACEDAKTQVEALGTKDQSTADAWNEALGFGSGAAAGRRMAVKTRRGVRSGRNVHRAVMDWEKVVRA